MLDIGDVVKGEIRSSYKRFCYKNCPVRWTMDGIEDKSKDELIETHCEYCLVKRFIQGELGVEFQ